MVGTIRFWNSEKCFGFATTDDGQEFYIGAPGLTGRTDLEGKRIQFDRATKRPDDVWTQKMNEGRLRDTVGVNARNPKRPRLPQQKPLAVNVVVIEEKS
jgi:cold shock CspA family protein